MTVVYIILTIFTVLIGLFVLINAVKGKTRAGVVFGLGLVLLGIVCGYGCFDELVLDHTVNEKEPAWKEWGEDVTGSSADVILHDDSEQQGDVGEDADLEEKIDLTDAQVLKRVPEILHGTAYISYETADTVLLDGSETTTWALLYNLEELRTSAYKFHIKDFRVGHIETIGDKTFIVLLSMADERTAVETDKVDTAKNFRMYLEVETETDITKWVGHAVELTVPNKALHYVVDSAAELDDTFDLTEDMVYWSPMAIPTFTVDIKDVAVGELDYE